MNPPMRAVPGPGLAPGPGAWIALPALSSPPHSPHTVFAIDRWTGQAWSVSAAREDDAWAELLNQVGTRA